MQFKIHADLNIPSVLSIVNYIGKRGYFIVDSYLRLIEFKAKKSNSLQI